MTAIALFSSVRLRLGATMESDNIKQAPDGQRQTPGTASARRRCLERVEGKRALRPAGSQRREPQGGESQGDANLTEEKDRERRALQPLWCPRPLLLQPPYDPRAPVFGDLNRPRLAIA